MAHGNSMEIAPNFVTQMESGKDKSDDSVTVCGESQISTFPNESTSNVNQKVMLTKK